MAELLQSPADLEVELAEQAPDDRVAQLRAFMAVMRERFQESASAESSLRTKMLSDRRFAAGDAQWDAADEAQRALDGRPVLKINRTPAFVKQVVNQIRNTRPGIEYLPVEDADTDMAEVIQGLARHVEQNSDADIAYDTATEHMCEMGRGWVRVRADWASDHSFEQELFIDRIRNPFTVYPDPAAKKFDYSDMRYCFIVEDMPLSTYKRKYSGRAIASLNEFGSIGDSGNWQWGQKIRVAEYYYLDYVEKTLVLVAPMPGDGGTPPDPSQVPTARFLDTLSDAEKAFIMPEGRTRKVQVPIVRWALVNGVDIIEGEEPTEEGAFPIQGRPVPGLFIPVVPFIGDERDIDGEVDLRGMVRDMKDAQRQVNYWQTAITEAIALAPKSPFIIAEGQITPNNKHLWENANKKNYAYLPYFPLQQNGTTLPPPIRNAVEPAIQAMVVANQIAEANLRAIAGFYDVQTRENDLNNMSGRAIRERREQAEQGNSNFQGNVGRAVRHVGRILLYMFPVVYDTARVKRIVGKDDREKNVMVFAGDENRPMVTPKDTKAYDLSVGRYDVRITTGQNFATKRKEALEAGMQLIQAVPQVGLVGADIIVKNIDAPGMTELSNRLKKVLVPKEAFDEQSGDPEQQLQVLKAQLQQMAQALTMMTQELNAKNDYIETEKVKSEAQERIKRIEIEGQLAKSALDGRVQMALLAMKGDQATDMTVVKAELEQGLRVVDAALAKLSMKQQAEIDISRDREDRGFQALMAQQEQQQPQQPPAGGAGGMA